MEDLQLTVTNGLSTGNMSIKQASKAVVQLQDVCMHVCVYVCVCMYVCVYMCVYLHVCTLAHVYMFLICDDDILQELSNAVISQWRKDEMRTKLKTLKKTVDDNDKANKAKLVEKVVLLSYLTYCKEM